MLYCNWRCTVGLFINPGNELFQRSRNSEVYVDKSGLIGFTNNALGTESSFLCVSRPRRFGKTMAANMIAAYYDRSCDSEKLFSGLEIADDPSFRKYLNKYYVIKLDIAGFIAGMDQRHGIATALSKALLLELSSVFSKIAPCDYASLSVSLAGIYSATGIPFVFVIDEWDAVFRECPNDIEEQNAYLNLLRSIFKNSSVSQSVALCYMTGILPVKKYNTQSALNNFSEFTMLDPLVLAPYVGFSEPEVKSLCKEHDMNFDAMKRWYDGYSFSNTHSIYSPYSVVQAVRFHKIKNYWTDTSSFDDAKDYINMDFDGLREDVTRMIAGERCRVNTRSFQNDFITLHTKDQVMTLLIHLGYLAYDEENREAYIPNLEVSERMADSVACSDWGFATKALSDSMDLLKATWAGDETKVASIADASHDQLSSFITYSSESDLAVVIRVAYYAASRYYLVRREFSSGKGYADAAFVPRVGCDVIPMIIELKWNRSVDEGIV
jgi:hypothetical protein